MTLLIAAEKVDLNPFNPEFGLYVWTLIAFAVVFFLLARRVFPRLQEGLADREHRIAEDLENAEKAKTEAEQALEEYKRRIAQAREESNSIVDEARKSAEAVRKDLIEKAEAESREIITRAQQQLDAERERTVGELKSQLAVWSSEIASRIIQKEINAETQTKLVEGFIKDLQKS